MGHWSCLPHVTVRRTHVRYREYSRYCEFLHEHPEYRKSMLSARIAESRKSTRTVGLPPEKHPEAGAGHHVARYPARHGARYGTRSTRMRWRRTGRGVGGRAGAVRGRRRARCTTAQRRRERAPSVECASEYSEYPGWPPRHSDPACSCLGRIRYSLGIACPTLGYSGYSHGVSCAWTRMAGSGWHRKW